MSDKKLLLKEILKKNSHKTQSTWNIANYLRQGVLAGSVWIFSQKQGDYLHSRGDGEN